MAHRQEAGSTPQRVLIIGAGMAGLAAGCYAQMNGFQAQIFEQHALPGGLCTAWTRRGYTFDVSLHMLMGARRGGMHRMWEELGVVQGRTIVDHPNGGMIEIDGKQYLIPNDIDGYETRMIEWGPDDAALVRELCDTARRLRGLEMGSDKANALANPVDGARFFWRNRRQLPALMKFRGVSIEQFAQRFKSPVLRTIMRLTAEMPSWPMPDMPAVVVAMLLAEREAANMGYPIGGSFNVAQTVARRFTDLGGTLHLKTRVARILVENDRAVGIALEDGSTVYGDYVISAADGRTTIWKWLEGRYLSEAICRAYREWRVYPPLVQVMLGVNRDVSAMPVHQSLELAQPIDVLGRRHQRMDVMHYGFDPSMAPAGKSVVQVWYATDYAAWEALLRDPDAYEAAKQRVANQVIDALDARWPGFRGQVEVVDVPTPTTFRRYTGNEQGSPDGWCMTTHNLTSAIGNTLPGLARFYMAGQWTIPFAGVPGSTMSGRDVVQMICREAGRRYTTSLPPAGWGPVQAGAPETYPAKKAAAAAARATAQTEDAWTRIVIDAKACQGCGDCVQEAPDLFAIGADGVALPLLDRVPPALAPAARAAQARCPDNAIQLEL